MEDVVRRLIKTEFTTFAEKQEKETFQEADDFDIEDDGEEYFSKYEIDDLAEEYPTEDPTPPETPSEPAAAADPPPEPSADVIFGGVDIS